VKIHPHDLLLKEFAASFPEDREECLAHLIQCSDCRNRLRRLLHWRPGDLPDRVVPLERRQDLVAANYDPLLDRISSSLWRIRSAYERERAEAPGLLSGLEQQALGKRPLLIRNCPRFQTWGLCELLLRRSEELNFHDATMGESVALLALEVIEQLDPASYGNEPLEDLRAYAWAHVANSRRVKADLRGSEEAFALASAALRRGTLEPMERAALFEYRAALLRAQRQFGRALSFLSRAAKIFLDLGEKHQAGRVLVKVSTVHQAAGEPERSIPVLYRALPLIDPIREPRLLLSAWHNLIDSLSDSGRFMEAQKVLAKARPLYRQFLEPWVQNRLKWVEGKIARGVGQKEQAEVLFVAAREGFLGERATYDVALVSLDLACLYAEQGRVAELKRLAEEMMPIFSSLLIHREALAALAFWKQAVEAEKAGLRLVTEVASYLKRAQHDPELRFERPQEP
jgi:tetratricopeptide (TPR) repeat protein